MRNAPTVASVRASEARRWYTRSSTVTRSRVSLRGSESPSIGTRGARVDASRSARTSGVRPGGSTRLSVRASRDTASVLPRQPFRQIADYGVSRPQLLLDDGELAAGFLEEQAARDEVEEREQIQEHDEEGAKDHEP